VFKKSSLVFCLLSVSVSLWLVPRPTSAAEPLPNTKPLTEEGNLSAKMVQGMHAYLDREIAASAKTRDGLWKLDKSTPEAYAKSIAPHRESLKKMLGLVDASVPAQMERISAVGRPPSVGSSENFDVYAVKWSVLPGVDAEGLLLEPKGKALTNVVAIPDSSWTPEEIAGLVKSEKGAKPYAARLADHGCRVVIPVLIDRNDTLSGNPKLGRTTNLPHREFIHRMAYEMGRTLIGYEVQKVLAAVDWFESQDKTIPIAVIGVGEGGRVALYAAAADERIKAAMVSCAFGPREKMYDEPLDRNLWTELREFGDAEVGALIHPRKLLIDPRADKLLDIKAGYWPEWGGPQPGMPGKGGAAPGVIKAISPEDVTREWKRFIALTARPVVKLGLLDAEGDWYGWRELLGSLREDFRDVPEHAVTTNRKNFDPAPRHKRQFDQLVAYTQKLWRDSEAVRKEFWKKANPSSPDAWEKSCEWYRDYFHNEVIGKLPEPTMPLNPRTRQVYDEKTWSGYEVMLDVYPDVYAYGILLMPKDLKPGEKRPVVVCQHGLEGTPRSTIDPEKNPVYAEFSKKLAEQGYIVYAPQNPYYGENTFRQLQRKANPLKLSLFSFIIRQHHINAPSTGSKRSRTSIPNALPSTVSVMAARLPCECRLSRSDTVSRSVRATSTSGWARMCRSISIAAICGLANMRCMSSISAARSITPRWRSSSLRDHSWSNADTTMVWVRTRWFRTSSPRCATCMRTD
jgi:dienelactone hydrolase